MTNYVYIRSEPQCWTVGFYDPDGNWHPVSDWSTSDEAQDQVALLNGNTTATAKRLSARIDALEAKVDENLARLVSENERLTKQLEAAQAEFIKEQPGKSRFYIR